ncbi:hypothetical protein PR048_011584 [Dryococelus australis]|uniref:Uncharacterized protein n=1 Tax=Dryococelus australis TaxID=614101 RepID=A0ABQ9HM46_9NEOP|nr:hypothetical protein PR048_011584 [Dryococelus australis]
MGDPRENPPTSGFFRHDSHVKKSGSGPARNQTRRTEEELTARILATCLDVQQAHDVFTECSEDVTSDSSMLMHYDQMFAVAHRDWGLSSVVRLQSGSPLAHTSIRPYVVCQEHACRVEQQRIPTSRGAVGLRAAGPGCGWLGVQIPDRTLVRDDILLIAGGTPSLPPVPHTRSLPATPHLASSLQASNLFPGPGSGESSCRKRQPGEEAPHSSPSLQTLVIPVNEHAEIKQHVYQSILPWFSSPPTCTSFNRDAGLRARVDQCVTAVSLKTNTKEYITYKQFLLKHSSPLHDYIWLSRELVPCWITLHTHTAPFELRHDPNLLPCGAFITVRVTVNSHRHLPLHRLRGRRVFTPSTVKAYNPLTQTDVNWARVHNVCSVVVTPLESRRAAYCGYNSIHPVWHALYECLQDIHGDSPPFLLQPFHELNNGFWPRLTSPHPAIQFDPKMFYKLSSGLWAGQSNWRTLFLAYHCIVALETWHLTLSSWNAGANDETQTDETQLPNRLRSKLPREARIAKAGETHCRGQLREEAEPISVPEQGCDRQDNVRATPFRRWFFAVQSGLRGTMLRNKPWVHIEAFTRDGCALHGTAPCRIRPKSVPSERRLRRRTHSSSAGRCALSSSKRMDPNRVAIAVDSLSDVPTYLHFMNFTVTLSCHTRSAVITNNLFQNRELLKARRTRPRELRDNNRPIGKQEPYPVPSGLRVHDIPFETYGAKANQKKHSQATTSQIPNVIVDTAHSGKYRSPCSRQFHKHPSAYQMMYRNSSLHYVRFTSTQITPNRAEI